MKKLTRVVVAGLVVMTLLLSLPAHAESPWMDGPLNVKAADSQNCSKETIVVATTDASAHYQRLNQVCVTHGRYVDIVLGYNSYVRFRTENEFRVLSIFENAHFAEGADTLIAEDKNPQYVSGDFVVVNNFSQALRPVQRNTKGVVTMYDIDPAKMERPLKGHSITSLAQSANGRYATAYVDYEGIVKIDLQTLKPKFILRLHSAWFYTSDVPYVTAISDNGQYVYVGNQEQLVDGSGCEADPPSSNDWYGYSTQCRVRYLGSVMSSQLGSFPQSTSGSFTDDNKLELEVRSRPYDSYYQKHVSITTSAYDATRLDYLALGDSYSSGEGDIEKDKDIGSYKYYLPLTDIGRDNCHLSSRSYPFLLRDYWHISSDKMKSIACSGAQVVYDYYGSPNRYGGQNDRLKGRSDIKEAQTIALDKFIPGRIPQLEFVKKYKPKVVTLTGGGNDVGFVEMLSYCAYGSSDTNSTWKIIKEGYFGLFTCAYAVPNSNIQQLTIKAIKDQYNYTVTLLNRIKEASPNTKVYIVGYPSFVTQNGRAYCPSSLELDMAERLAIQYFLELLNRTLQQAAAGQGVEFIDVENSLGGGRLCERDNSYVTGPLNVNLSVGVEKQNIFHPNALGHKKMAAAIYDGIANHADTSTLTLVSKPSSVGDAAYAGNASQMTVTSSDLQRNGSVTIAVDPYTFEPGSTVKLTLHSNPIDLGTIAVAPDGSISQSVETHNLPAGYHVLTLEGKSYSGEPLTIYQFVTVGLQEDAAILNTVQDSATDPLKNNKNTRLDAQSAKNSQDPVPMAAGDDSIMITDNSKYKQEQRGQVSQKQPKRLNQIGVWITISIVIMAVSVVGYTYKRRYKQ